MSGVGTLLQSPACSKKFYRLGHIVVIFPNCPQSNQLVVISHGTQGRGRQPEVESISPGAIWKILKRVQTDLNEHSMKCENLWCSIPQGKYQPLPIMDCHEKFIISIIVNHVFFSGLQIQRRLQNLYGGDVKSFHQGVFICFVPESVHIGCHGEVKSVLKTRFTWSSSF